MVLSLRVSHKSVTVSLHHQYQEPEAVKRNSAVITFFCAFPPGTCQHVFTPGASCSVQAI